MESPSRSSSGIAIPPPSDTLGAQVGQVVSAFVAEQITSQIGKVDQHVRSARSVGYGVIFMVGIALGVGAYSYYASKERQEIRDETQDARHLQLQKSLDDNVTDVRRLVEALSERPIEDQAARAAANRTTRALNELYDRVLGGRARPMALPFPDPDIVTHATR